MNKKINKEAGQASRVLLVLAVVVLVAVIVVYLVMRMADRPSSPIQGGEDVELPVYEQQIGDIRFVFESALDKGSYLNSSEVVNTRYTSRVDNLPVSNTGAKFVVVTIGAQNKGTENTKDGIWDIGNIVDSEGRNFVPVEGSSVKPWLPEEDKCGELLKPAFDPTACVKIYEVSKQSTGLKIGVFVGTGDNAKSALIDLIVK